MKKVSEETRQKMREAKLRNPTRYWLGKKRAPFSEETIKKITLASTGRKHTIDSRKKISRARIGIKFSEITKQRISKNRRGIHMDNDHHLWKGENASYSAKHYWMQTHFGKPEYCEGCGNEEAIIYEWANISGKYRRDRADWLRLCGKCHFSFDNKGKKMWNTRKRNKLELNTIL